MDKRTLGPNGPAVAALGRDCMGMSDFHGPAGLKGAQDFRAHQPRFGGANLERDLALLDNERPRQA